MSVLNRQLAKWILPEGNLDFLGEEWRFIYFERNIMFVVKAAVIIMLFSHLIWSHTFYPLPLRPGLLPIYINRADTIQMIQYFVIGYLAFTISQGFLLFGLNSLSKQWLHAIILGGIVTDALLAGAMLIFTEGLNSELFWWFPLLLLRSSYSLQLGWSLIISMALIIGTYVLGVWIDWRVTIADAEYAQLTQLPVIYQPYQLNKLFYLKVSLLAGIGIWLIAFRVTLEMIRQHKLEEAEINLRKEQLAASGRLAAEIAHKLKNPLAIINNASYTLQKTVKEGKKTITQQIQIIREEVARSDQLITQLMGYAQLLEGKVERVNVRQEIENAIMQVFPPAVQFEITIIRDYGPGVPDLLIQRQHLNDILINILVNAREALNGKGTIWIATRFNVNQMVEIRIKDNGPGIPPEIKDRVFEPYFTTKEHGTGLGLAIVKHNVEMYGGSVKIYSESGKGTEVVVEFPAVSMIRLRR